MTNQPLFDVFLAHHSQDKPQVRAIATQLKRLGLKPWLDEDQIPPGRSFQDVIQQAIPNVKSAAIFIGPRGLGDWQLEELRSVIKQCATKGIPAIPVLLPGVNAVPENLLFLGERRWVDFCNQTNEAEALDSLVWGITGTRPQPQPDAKPNENSPNAEPRKSNLSLLLIVAIIGITAGAFTTLAITYFHSPQRFRVSLDKQICFNDEENLVNQDRNLSKKDGIKAFANGDFQTAINKLQGARKVDSSDPETLIYLNNAEAARVGIKQTFKIAVSVPIGNNPNIAQEILRGVAQAQLEVNQNGGIERKPLQVKITNDNNEQKLAAKIADELVKDPTILAVVGHNSSEASIAAAPVYEKGGLVMITPTSDANSLFESSSPIFHTMPKIRNTAKHLTNYVIKTVHKNNIAICFDSKAKASKSLKGEFEDAIKESGGKVVSADCDFSAENFKPSIIWSNVINKGANGILLLPGVKTIDKAINIAQANRGRLTLLGSPTINMHQTLKQGRCDVNGMIVAIPWNPTADGGKTFTEKAVKLWGRRVNWRTAMAYDATRAITTGLERGGNTRDGLKKVLTDKVFSVDGSTGKIQFQGDRETSVSLLKVQPSDVTDTGYDFVPFQPKP